MFEIIKVEQGIALDEYAKNAHLTAAVLDLKNEASALVPRLEGRKLWMVNSTAAGGGVAEMLPKVIGLLREVGVPTEWLVIGTDKQPFFPLTKKLHNQIHGAGEATISAAEREVYEAVSRDLAKEFGPSVSKDDLLVVHDPQPAGMGALIKKETGCFAVWRCHIGLDASTEQTRAAWDFLRPHIQMYDHSVFSAPEYIPEYITGDVSVIHPAIDPLSYKNRDLSAHMVQGVLCNAGLSEERHPVLVADYERQAERLQPDGTFGQATKPEEIGLLFRTVITQISRWDRLKGWAPLLEAFVRLKKNAKEGRYQLDSRQRRRIEIARLVMAGPEPAAVADDPEAKQVLEELCTAYTKLDPEVQRDVVLLSLPMSSRMQNHLMVNALQRCSSVVVQNSVQEGFGLTVTEAMWKRVAVLGSSACGIRQQIRDGVDGRIIADPNDPEQVEAGLLDLLNHNEAREMYALHAQRRVHDEFLVFTQVRRWLEVLATMVTGMRSSLRPSALRSQRP